MLYSDYESHTTAKVLVGIISSGGLSFISKSFPGSTSDTEITLRSGILKPLMWENGDALMAGSGFTVREYTDVFNIELLIPCFFKGKGSIIRSRNCYNTTNC